MTYQDTRGVVGFVGPTEFAEGIWVGIELDRPGGKNDGSVLGKYYFACTPEHGVFVRKSTLLKLDPSGGGPEEIHIIYDLPPL